MEVSSFSFLNQEDYTNFYTLFQDTDENCTKKRRTNNTHNQSSENETLKDVLATLMCLDEEEKSEEQQKWIPPPPPPPTTTDHQNSLFDSYFNQQPMNNHHHYPDGPDQFQGFFFPNLDDTQQLKLQQTKRPRHQPKATLPNVSDQLAGSGSGTGGGQHRRLWVKNRSKAWWEQCNHPDFQEEEFRRAFRMSRATFDMICDELDSAVTKKDTMLRLAIPVRQRVAVCIWRLATGEPLRLVSKRFGLGISTCHKLVLEVCLAIKTVLMPKFLNWPDHTKLKEIKDEFELVSGIPNLGGSIYTTHVPIIAPKSSVAAYFNKRHTERSQKTCYSITVQGVVDPKGVFTDVCIGWPGSMPDDKILEKSALHQRANRGLLKDVQIVGNSGYPLMDWVLVPYTHQNFTWAQHSFNEKIAEVQRIAKEAFMRLKGRWSCLQKRTEVKLQDLPVVLGACCVLHNICEMRNERMDEELRFHLFDDELVPENAVRSVTAMQARDNIAHHLLHNNIAASGTLL